MLLSNESQVIATSILLIQVCLNIDVYLLQMTYCHFYTVSIPNYILPTELFHMQLLDMTDYAISSLCMVSSNRSKLSKNSSLCH